MNFIFEWLKLYFTNERSEVVRTIFYEWSAYFWFLSIFYILEQTFVVLLKNKFVRIFIVIFSIRFFHKIFNWKPPFFDVSKTDPSPIVWSLFQILGLLLPGRGRGGELEKEPTNLQRQFIVDYITNGEKMERHLRPFVQDLQCQVLLITFCAWILGKFCGDIAYDPTTHVCCCDKVHKKNSDYECCGEKYYNPSEKMCCPGASLEPLEGGCPVKFWKLPLYFKKGLFVLGREHITLLFDNL